MGDDMENKESILSGMGENNPVSPEVPSVSQNANPIEKVHPIASVNIPKQAANDREGLGAVRRFLGRFIHHPETSGMLKKGARVVASAGIAGMGVTGIGATKTEAAAPPEAHRQVTGMPDYGIAKEAVQTEGGWSEQAQKWAKAGKGVETESGQPPAKPFEHQPSEVPKPPIMPDGTPILNEEKNPYDPVKDSEPHKYWNLIEGRYKNQLIIYLTDLGVSADRNLSWKQLKDLAEKAREEHALQAETEDEGGTITGQNGQKGPEGNGQPKGKDIWSTLKEGLSEVAKSIGVSLAWINEATGGALGLLTGFAIIGGIYARGRDIIKWTVYKAVGVNSWIGRKIKEGLGGLVLLGIVPVDFIIRKITFDIKLPFWALGWAADKIVPLRALNRFALFRGISQTATWLPRQFSHLGDKVGKETIKWGHEALKGPLNRMSDEKLLREVEKGWEKEYGNKDGVLGGREITINGEKEFVSLGGGDLTKREMDYLKAQRLKASKGTVVNIVRAGLNKARQAVGLDIQNVEPNPFLIMDTAVLPSFIQESFSIEKSNPPIGKLTEMFEKGIVTPEDSQAIQIHWMFLDWTTTHFGLFDTAYDQQKAWDSAPSEYKLDPIEDKLDQAIWQAEDKARIKWEDINTGLAQTMLTIPGVKYLVERVVNKPGGSTYSGKDLIKEGKRYLIEAFKEVGYPGVQLRVDMAEEGAVMFFVNRGEGKLVGKPKFKSPSMRAKEAFGKLEKGADDAGKEVAGGFFRR